MIEPRKSYRRGSPRGRISVGSIDAPSWSGAPVRPGSESTAELHRVSREAGRASCLLGRKNRQGTTPVKQGPEQRPTPPRSDVCENSRGAEVSHTERPSEGAETDRGSLSRRIVAIENGVTDPREPVSSEGSGRDADVSLATRAGPEPDTTCGIRKRHIDMGSNPHFEEPDALIALVRFCGGPRPAAGPDGPIPDPGQPHLPFAVRIAWTPVLDDSVCQGPRKRRDFCKSTRSGLVPSESVGYFDRTMNPT